MGNYVVRVFEKVLSLSNLATCDPCHFFAKVVNLKLPLGFYGKLMFCKSPRQRTNSSDVCVARNEVSLRACQADLQTASDDICRQKSGCRLKQTVHCLGSVGSGH